MPKQRKRVLIQTLVGKMFSVAGTSFFPFPPSQLSCRRVVTTLWIRPQSVKNRLLKVESEIPHASCARDLCAFALVVYISIIWTWRPNEKMDKIMDAVQVLLESK